MLIRDATNALMRQATTWAWPSVEQRSAAKAAVQAAAECLNRSGDPLAHFAAWMQGFCGGCHPAELHPEEILSIVKSHRGCKPACLAERRAVKGLHGVADEPD